MFTTHSSIMTLSSYNWSVLDLSVLGDKSFQLNGYHLLRADHSSNTKWGGVCIYYKESLHVREVTLSNLSQWIICEFP